MIVKPVEREELRKHTDELFRLLSCPSDDLSDVRIPASGLYGESIYNISYRQMAIPILNVKLIADLPEDGRQYMLHHISVNIPRFLANETVDIPSVQRLWTEKLCELGKLFPLCLGSADMDQSHPNGFSAFDRANGDIYLSDRIPGYAWAMLVNATQRKKIHVPASGEIPGFYKTVVFDNGNLFFQKTADMRFMTWEDCHSLREFFKPSLTPAPLEHPYTTTFPTYRAGFLPEEIDFDMKLKPWSDFAVRHEEGKDPDSQSW